MNRIQLKDLCSVRSSSLKAGDVHQMSSGGFPVFGASGPIAGIDTYQMDKPALAIVKDGAGFGRVFKTPAHSSVVGTMQFIIPADEVDRDYLYYLLDSIDFRKYKSGATIPHIYFKDYSSLRLKQHSLSEQRVIAQTLDRVAEILQNLRSEYLEFDSLVKSRFIEMFGDPENNPMNWQVLTVGEAVVRGYLEKPLDGNHGEKHPKAEEYVKNGIPFIMANDLKDGTVDFKHCSFITENRAKKLDKGFAKDGDVLLTHKGTIGITAIMKKLPSKFAMLTPQVTYYRIYNGLTQEYLKCYFETDYFQKVLRMRSSGATRAYIGITKQLELPVMIPNIGNQASFSRFINSIDKSKLAIQKSIDELENLKKKLMQEYFG